MNSTLEDLAVLGLQPLLGGPRHVSGLFILPYELSILILDYKKYVVTVLLMFYRQADLMDLRTGQYPCLLPATPDLLF